MLSNAPAERPSDEGNLKRSPYILSAMHNESVPISQSRDLLYEPQRHIPALDGVRGLAILAVLGIHLMYEAPIPPPPPSYLSFIHIFQFGWMGVDLFFVLSGFLITGILLDTQSSSNYFRSFYGRRTLRIFPLYYGILLVTLALSPWLRHTRMTAMLPERGVWIFWLLYVQNWWVGFHPLAYMGAFGATWSLGVEEQFYLMWPLLVLLPRRIFVWLCIALCLLCPLLRVILCRHDPTSVFVFMNIFTRMDTLVWGALAALLVRSPRLMQRVRPLLPYILVTCAAGLLVIDFPLHDFYRRGFATQTFGFSVIAVGFTAFLLLAYISDSTGGRLGRWLRNPLLRSFGRYSYCIYLVHGILLIALHAYIAPMPWYGRSAPSGLVVCVAFCAACWAVGWISYHCFERYFLLLKKAFTPSSRDPATRPG